ncbi:MAG: SPOR domain-containing protein, partial [Pseudomonadales bacterium]
MLQWCSDPSSKVLVVTAEKPAERSWLCGKLSEHLGVMAPTPPVQGSKLGSTRETLNAVADSFAVDRTGAVSQDQLMSHLTAAISWICTSTARSILLVDRADLSSPDALEVLLELVSATSMRLVLFGHQETLELTNQIARFLVLNPIEVCVDGAETNGRKRLQALSEMVKAKAAAPLRAAKRTHITGGTIAVGIVAVSVLLYDVDVEQSPAKPPVNDPTLTLVPPPAAVPLLAATRAEAPNPPERSRDTIDLVQPVPVEQQPKHRRNNAWLLLQPPQTYTIQLATFYRLADAQEFIQSQPSSEELGIFQINRNGRTLYAVIHGLYNRYGEALAVAQVMPDLAQSNDPLVRSVKLLQRDLLAQRQD